MKKFDTIKNLSVWMDEAPDAEGKFAFQVKSGNTTIENGLGESKQSAKHKALITADLVIREDKVEFLVFRAKVIKGIIRTMKANLSGNPEKNPANPLTSEYVGGTIDYPNQYGSLPYGVEDAFDEGALDKEKNIAETVEALAGPVQDLYTAHCAVL